MPGKKQTRGITTYNILLREITLLNNNLPEDRKLSLKERREILSKKVYPLYKGTAKRYLRKKEIRETLVKKLQRLPRKPTCDVTEIPEDFYESVPYFDIDQFLTQIIPNCVFVRVFAANFGETKIFNTRDYSYYSTTLSDITNRINQWVRQQPKPKRGSDKVPFYVGQVQVKPGKKNDGNPDSYFLEMVLVIKGITAKEIEPVEVPKGKKKKKRKGQKTVRQLIEERTRGLLMEKSKIKKIRQLLLREIQDFRKLIKKRYFTKEQRIESAKKAFDVEKRKIDRAYEKKIIDKTRHADLIRTAKKGFNQ